MAEIKILEIVKPEIFSDIDKVDALGTILTRAQNHLSMDKDDNRHFLQECWSLHETLLNARNSAEKETRLEVVKKCALCNEDAEPGKDKCWICIAEGSDEIKVAPVEEPGPELRRVRSKCGGFDYIMAGITTVCIMTAPPAESPALVKGHEKRVAQIVNGPQLYSVCRKLIDELKGFSLDEDDPFRPLFSEGMAVLDNIEKGCA